MYYYKTAQHWYTAILSQFMLLKQSAIQIVTQSLFPLHCVSNYLCVHDAYSMYVCMYACMYACMYV